MTTTTNKTPRLRQTERPIDAQGPIVVLENQLLKLEDALRWAEEKVKYKQNTLAEAIERRDQIIKDLELTGRIINEYGHNPECILENKNHDSMCITLPLVPGELPEFKG